jgi:hypothetical protein
MRKLARALGIAMTLAAPAAMADDDVWNARDYTEHYFLYRNGHVPLPHLRDAAPRVLFEHLIDPRNIAAIADSPALAEEKLRQLRIILALLGAYRSSYGVAVMVGEPIEEELARVQAYSLQVAGAVAKLMQQSQASLVSLPAGATLVEGVFESVEENGPAAPAQAALLAEAVSLHYPDIAAALRAEDRRHLRDQALLLNPGSDDEALLRSLRRMRDVLSVHL